MIVDSRVLGDICDRISQLLEANAEEIGEVCLETGKINLGVSIKIVDKGGYPKVNIKLAGVTKKIEGCSEGILGTNQVDMFK